MKEFNKVDNTVIELDNHVKCDCCGAKSELTIDVWPETWLCRECILDLCHDFS